jgi:hypothetical protein
MTCDVPAQDHGQPLKAIAILVFEGVVGLDEFRQLEVPSLTLRHLAARGALQGSAAFPSSLGSLLTPTTLEDVDAVPSGAGEETAGEQQQGKKGAGGAAAAAGGERGMSTPEDKGGGGDGGVGGARQSGVKASAATPPNNARAGPWPGVNPTGAPPPPPQQQSQQAPPIPSRLLVQGPRQVRALGAGVNIPLGTLTVQLASSTNQPVPLPRGAALELLLQPSALSLEGTGRAVRVIVPGNNQVC